MVKIYSEKIQKSDETYYLICNVVCGLLFCIFMCVGLILLITLVIENDGSN